MEVFSVFATLSLVDLISSPLARMKAAMRGAEGGVNSFGASMGKLTMGMAPVALAAGVVLGALGLCTSQAMAFESAMADVAKVVNFNGPAEFKAMSDQVKELSSRIPMAASGIAAIIASAGQSGVAKNDLAEFAEQAAKMGVAFDLTGDQSGKMMADWRAGMALTLPQTYALADAVNYLSNNMNATAPALGEVIQRVGGAAMACGLAETQVAALGAAFLSAGASPEVAATALRKFTGTLVKGTAMSKTQAAAFSGLGFSITQMAKDMQTNAQGTIFKVLQAIADKPKELQMSLLTEMFGEESIGAIAPLLKNMGLLSQSFELVGDAANYAGSMQAEFDARSKTAQNALQLLTNKLNNLAISIGTVFLPAVSWAAAKLGVFVDAVRSVVDNPLGQWLVEMAGGISAAILGVTALSAALWFASAAWPMLAGALAPLKAALLGLSWPVLVAIAVVAALYAAYKSNFGGIADTVNRWGRTISVVVRGVIAIFESLTGTTFEIKGALAEEIRAEGLENLVVSVARIVWRIKEFFMGIWDGLNFDAAVSTLTPAILLIGDIFTTVGEAVANVFGGSLSVAGSEARSFGEIVGMGLAWALEGVAVVIANVVRGVDTLVSLFRWCAAVLNGDWATAANMGERIWNNFCASLMAFADLFRIGDWIRAAWADAQAYLAGINLYDSGVALLQTLANGIKSAAMAPVNAVMEALQWVRDLLPFSDAKVGPLSELTASGGALMSTLAEGVAGKAGALYESVTGALGSVKETLVGWWGKAKSLWSGEILTAEIAARPATELYRPVSAALPIADISQATPEISRINYGFGRNVLPAPVPPVVMPEIKTPKPHIPEPAAFATSPDTDDPRTNQRRAGEGNTTITIHIGSIALPNVANGQDFFNDLQGLVAGYGGSAA